MSNCQVERAAQEGHTPTAPRRSEVAIGVNHPPEEGQKSRVYNTRRWGFYLFLRMLHVKPHVKPPSSGATVHPLNTRMVNCTIMYHENAICMRWCPFLHEYGSNHRSDGCNRHVSITAICPCAPIGIHGSSSDAIIKKPLILVPFRSLHHNTTATMSDLGVNVSVGTIAAVGATVQSIVFAVERFPVMVVVTAA